MSDLEKLRAFANAIVDSHTGSIEGCDIEEIAVKYGLVVAIEVTGPCADEDVDGGSSCSCREFGFPGTCIRRTPLLTGAE